MIMVRCFRDMLQQDRGMFRTHHPGVAGVVSDIDSCLAFDPSSAALTIWSRTKKQKLVLYRPHPHRPNAEAVSSAMERLQTHFEGDLSHAGTSAIGRGS